jgi:hypothetical protein
MTGDLVWVTPAGDTKTLELSTFHIPHMTAERAHTLAILETHLSSLDPAVNASRAGVVRIAAGDGNCLWHPDELTYADRQATDTDRARHSTTDFKDHMERITDLRNQKPPGSFDPSRFYTHSQGACRTRLDYLFSNIHMVGHVRHTDPVDGICVRPKNPAENSSHYWLEATPPLALLGFVRLPNVATFRPEPRLDFNLANKTERVRLHKLAQPALASFASRLPSEVRQAYVSAGVLSESSDPAAWALCAAALPAAIQAIRDFAGPSLADALAREPAAGPGPGPQQPAAPAPAGAPAPAPARQPRPLQPGERIRQSVAPEAAPHRRAEI